MIKGDRNTGKSCLFQRLQGKPFNEQYIPTNEIQVLCVKFLSVYSREETKIYRSLLLLHSQWSESVVIVIYYKLYIYDHPIVQVHLGALYHSPIETVLESKSNLNHKMYMCVDTIYNVIP